jgi:hypothetical protein
MLQKLSLWRWRLGLALGLLDSIWSASALSLGRNLNEGSTVQLSGLMVWIFLHLPAALLASWPFGQASGPLPFGELLLMGFLGCLQLIAIGAWLGWRMDRRREAR